MLADCACLISHLLCQFTSFIRVQGQPEDLGGITPRTETGVASGTVTLMDTFWSHTAAAFTSAVQQAVSRGGVVRDSLVTSFPRLLALIEGTLDKCVRETDVPGVSTSISAVNRQALMHALQLLQEAFLSASLARMLQAVSGLYAPGNARTLPSAVTQCVGYVTVPVLVCLYGHVFSRQCWAANRIEQQFNMI